MLELWGHLWKLQVYAKTILYQVDIMAMSEHWLYEDELSFLNELNNEFRCYAKLSFENVITLISVGAEVKVGWHCFGIKAKFRYKRSIQIVIAWSR